MGVPAVNRALELFMLAAALSGAACASDGATGTSNASGVTPNTRAPAGSVTCGTAKAIFTRSPVALTDFFGWVPLGNMGPPAHTFPTDHQYIYVNDPSSQAPRRDVNIDAPSDIIITKAHAATNTPGSSDYTLEFSPCAEVYAQFPGWSESIAAVRSLADLPENARRYVTAIEEYARVPIVLVSVGPERTQTIERAWRPMRNRPGIVA